jgi:hypothetical protein
MLVQQILKSIEKYEIMAENQNITDGLVMFSVRGADSEVLVLKSNIQNQLQNI